jgi:hypothetical protein
MGPTFFGPPTAPVLCPTLENFFTAPATPTFFTPGGGPPPALFATIVPCSTLILWLMEEVEAKDFTSLVIA